MRIILVIFFIHLSSVSLCQSRLDRFYGQMDYGFRRHWGIGLTVHSFDHLSAAFSYSSSRWQHEEAYYTPKNMLFNEEHRLYDAANKFNLLIGVTTMNLNILDLSLMVGPSYIEHTVFSNVAVEYHYDYYGDLIEGFTYDLEEKSTFGIATRGDLSFAISNGVGLNLGLEANFNEVRNYYKILIGLSIGLVRDRDAWQNR